MQSRIVKCKDCGNEFDTEAGGMYGYQDGKFTCPSCWKAERPDLPAALETLYDAVDDYIYSSADNAYPDDYCNPEFLADLRIAFLNTADALETEKQACAALAAARGAEGAA